MQSGVFIFDACGCSLAVWAWCLPRGWFPVRFPVGCGRFVFALLLQGMPVTRQCHLTHLVCHARPVGAEYWRNNQKREYNILIENKTHQYIRFDRPRYCAFLRLHLSQPTPSGVIAWLLVGSASIDNSVATFPCRNFLWCD